MIEGMAMEDLQRYAAETEMNEGRAMMMDNGEWHRVVLSNLASVNDARMQGDVLQGRFGIQGYWVTRQ